LSWARRGGHVYFVRWRWEDGRSVSQYVGYGPLADIAANNDRLHRLERDAARRAWETEAARAAEGTRTTKAFSEMADLIVRATLIVAGFHRYAGQWRRRRERLNPIPSRRRARSRMA
jgi:hypothetical protein